MNQPKAKEIIQEIFKLLDWNLNEVEITSEKENEYYINVDVGDDTVSLLSGRGDQMYALQYLLKNIFRKQNVLEEGENYRFDVGGYRHKQEENVLQMARQRADEVVQSQKSVTLPPMSPYFRRLVHLEISEKYPDLMTESTGVGDYRAVRIMMKG